jgi:radical SAM superfamily enzyme YgiQ (UPF0313 family)
LLTYPNQLWHKDDCNTNWNLNPATLCLLAATVEELVEVRIVDAQFRNLSLEEFQQEVADFDPHYVGISVLSSEYGSTLHQAAAAVKAVSPRIVTIAGGIHVTIEYAEVFRDANLDYAVRGEGEEVLPALLRFLEGDGPRPETGLIYREGDQVVAQPQALVADISQLPWPAYHLVELKEYLATGPRVGPLRPTAFPYIRMSVTRGCPFGCSFCQVETISGVGIRTRSAKDVVDELSYLKERYGIRSVQFDDDNIIGNRRFFRELLHEMIERDLGLPYLIGAFAVFLLTDDILELMVRSGCVGVNVAIESGNPRVLKEIVGKPVDLEKARAAIGKIREKGLFCLANFIIGFPGESWQEIRETVEYAEQCGADYVKIFVAVPLKNTRLWEIAVAQDAIADPAGYRVDWRFSQIRSDQWSSKDVSVLRAYEWDRINFATPEKRRRVAELWGIDPAELEAIRKQTRDSIVF